MVGTEAIYEFSSLPDGGFITFCMCGVRGCVGDFRINGELFALLCTDCLNAVRTSGVAGLQNRLHDRAQRRREDAEDLDRTAAGLNADAHVIVRQQISESE